MIKNSWQRDEKPLPVSYLTAVPPHICIMQAANYSADDSARHGQKVEKKKNSDYWIEYFLLNFFSTKNRKQKLKILQRNQKKHC